MAETWQIENGLLVAAPPGVELRQEPDNAGAPITPELLVVHYAVTHSVAMTSAALRASDYVSAHLSIDGFRDGDRSVMQVIQHVPFNRRAGHAGSDARWQGRVGVNSFSIGVEIANPGPLIEQADGTLRTTYQKLWTEEPGFVGPHQHNRSPRNWTHWARYTDEEYGLLASLGLALIQAYPSVVDVCGHDDIRTDKFDPGPAFAMEWLRGMLWPERADTDPATAMDST